MVWSELAGLLPVRDLLLVLAAEGAAGRAVPVKREAVLGALAAYGGRNGECAGRLRRCLLEATGPLVRLEAWACTCVR